MINYNKKNVQVDFRKQTMVRALQLAAPKCLKFGSLSIPREIIIEYYDINGDVLKYNEGKPLVGSTLTDSVEIVPLPQTIKTNIIRIYFKSIVGLKTQVLYILR